MALLQVTNRVLVGVLKVQRYHKGKSSGRFDDTSPFTYRSYVFIVDKDGRVLAPLRASKLARAAVDALKPREERDFLPRFKAIAASSRK